MITELRGFFFVGKGGERMNERDARGGRRPERYFPYRNDVLP